jgi:hypothetical protein
MQFIFPPHVQVIVVNGAADFVPNFDIWFTLDPSKENLQRMGRRSNPFARYYAAVMPDRKLPPEITKLERVENDGVEKFAHPLARRYRCSYGLQEHPGKISTGNSAFGALNLAYHLGAGKIALFGVDGTQEERVSGGTPGPLDFLPELFYSAFDQLNKKNIGVINGSPYSRVTCFPRFPREEALQWISG